MRIVTNRRRSLGAFIFSLATLFPAVGLYAQGAPKTSSELGINYQEQIKNLGSIASLGDDLFGDRTNLYTGETTFAQTDVDLPGNNPLPLRLTRGFSGIGGPTLYPRPAAFADWELELPYITGVFGTPHGWISMVSGNPLRRCSIPADQPSWASPPPEHVLASGSTSGVSFDPWFFWNGNSLHMPEGGDQNMLVLGAVSARPNDGNSYYWVTSGRWLVSCLPATANGVPGEGFMVHSPNGDRYWFDWIVRRSAGQISAYFGVGQFGLVSRLDLSQYRALPTRIEDSNGNAVIFTYAPASERLLSIRATDGREIQMSYNNYGYVSEVRAGDRVWQYGYSGEDNIMRLTTVILPDGTSWKFGFDLLKGKGVNGWRNCADYLPIYDGQASINTMTHPSGAVGVFEFRAREHGRTDAPNSCRVLGNSMLPAASHILEAYSLYSKKIYASGVENKVWTFAYSPLAASVKESGGEITRVYCVESPCPTTRNLTVTRENGEWDRYVFSQKYGDLEGRMLLEERGIGNQVLRRVDTQYHKSANGSYAKIGTDPCWLCNKEEETPKPVESKIILQDGVKFSYQVLEYDGFARPTKILKGRAL